MNVFVSVCAGVVWKVNVVGINVYVPMLESCALTAKGMLEL